MRVFATSDLHTDYRENVRWLEQISRSDYRNDALIVAGDISDRFEVIRDTLQLLRSRFRHLLFTPGNHELWVRTAEYDSIEKLRRVLELCRELDVSTSPVRFDNFWVVPLFSWYDGIFDPQLSGERTARQAWADFHFCKWPAGASPLPDHFLRLNEPHLRKYDAPVITFSHFLPRAELLPPKEYLKISWLGSVSVCAGLDIQIRKLESKLHVCGHTHTNVDHVIDGVRYVQNAVRYPKERTSASIPIKLIWNP
jgi:calcineurin-like phosphoesterase family protein